MKKPVLLFIFIAMLILIALVLFRSFAPESSVPQKSATENPTPTSFNKNNKIPQNSVEVSVDNAPFRIYYSQISGKTISLIPNFENKQSASAIVEEKKCQIAINGGFYTKEGAPLGLFISGGKIFNEQLKDKNTFLNGFFIVDNDGKLSLEKVAKTSANIALQSGPFMSQNIRLNTTVDETARRSVLVKTTTGDIYAVIVTEKENSYIGPTLSQLPLIIFSAPFPFTVQSALNLDGGSASFYFNRDNSSLWELTAVGSLICVK